MGSEHSPARFPIGQFGAFTSETTKWVACHYPIAIEVPTTAEAAGDPEIETT